MRKENCLMLFGCFFLLVAVCLMPFAGATAAEKKEIGVFGAPASFTGGGAMTAAEQIWAYKTAVADINKKGGVFVKDLNKKLPIKLVFADDKTITGWSISRHGTAYQGGQK